MQDFLDNVNDVFNAVLNWVLQYLPDSPFLHIGFPPEMEYWLGILNYYVPFSGLVILGASWATCMAIYYTFQVILRNARAIK